MKKTNLESAKSILEEEIRTHDYTRENLYGNAASLRKLEDYIIESVISGVNKGECLDWIVSLLQDYKVHEKYIRTTHSSAELQYSILSRAIDNKSLQIKQL